MLLKTLCLLLLVSNLRASPLWQLSVTDGQPGCRTRYELTRLWRNNHDSHSYWMCSTLGEAAVSISCAPGTSFQDHWQTCVPSSSYEWTPAFNPPSSPDDDWMENSVTECPPCEPITEAPVTTLCPPCPEVTTICPPCPEVPTLCPPCPPEDNGNSEDTQTEGSVDTQDSSEETQSSFVCTEERLGTRWPSDSSDSYWECPGLMQEPFLINCPPGFEFNFVRQMCAV